MLALGPLEQQGGTSPPVLGGGTEYEAIDGFHYNVFEAVGTDTATPTGVLTAEVLVVAGGASGGAGGGATATRSGGGGAGGVRTDATLALSSAETITTGSGGGTTTPANTNGNDGNDSSIGALLVCNGGGGGAGVPNANGRPGGSGGGGAGSTAGASGTGGAATPAGEGFAGGNGNTTGTNASRRGGGGGGAAEVGNTDGNSHGGDGLFFPQFKIRGFPDGWYGGGGGGGIQSNTGVGGEGGGGLGAVSGATAGVAGTGGGGGGNNATGAPAGGSGIVIARRVSLILPPAIADAWVYYVATTALTLPAGSGVGDLIVAFNHQAYAGGHAALTSSYTLIIPDTDSGGNSHAICVARVLTGGAGDALTVSASSTAAVFRFPAGQHSVVNVATDIAVAVTTGHTLGVINTPTLTPASGTDYGWMTLGALSNTTTVPDITSAPTGFAKAVSIANGPGLSRSRIMVAGRREVAASMAPNGFPTSVATPNGTIGMTIAIPG